MGTSVSRKPPDAGIITGLSLPTFAWNANKIVFPAARVPRQRVVKIALDWQQISFNGSWSESMSATSYPGQAGTWKPGRVNELAGLMGSAGEQLCLAWTADQDAQRWGQGGRGIYRLQKRMAIRALAEMSSYFSLGAANTLANIVLRVLILDERAIGPLGWAAAFAPSIYKPGSTLRKEWMSFPGSMVNKLEQVIPTISSDRCIGPKRLDVAKRRCRSLLAVLKSLEVDKRFSALAERRGMDYHRHRPQSLDSGSPRGGVWTHGPGYRAIGVGGVYPDPDYEETEVHRIAADGLEAVTTAMSRARTLIVSAAASMGYILIE